MDDILLEPAKAYRECYEKSFADSAEECFAELVKRSGIDVELNRKTVKEYKEASNLASLHDKKLSNQKALRVFVIILTVAAFITAIVGVFSIIDGGMIAGIVMLVVGVLLGVGFILITVLVLNKKIASQKAVVSDLKEKADKILMRAWEQMQPLNALFDSNITKNLIEKTVPLLKIDDNFDMRRYDYLNGKYGLHDNTDDECSTIGILTGEILGNPFVVNRQLVMDMGSQTYTGYLTISWTTSYTDSEGNVHTETHTQTLSASVTKPKPYYSQHTFLIYGNEAAPDLMFTHYPSHAERLNEKELERKVRSGEKTIQKKQAQALKNGGNFTEMGNSEFDVLFGALDRNNEVQFRLMFTPLAQKNMLTLMKDNTGFGDDFQFHKQGCLNYISSEHSAKWDMNTSFDRYFSFDIDTSKAEFLRFNREYFKALFFDLAPLLSVPLYQQHKPKEYIYKTLYERNYTSFESEYLANRLGDNAFKHSLSVTPAILKANLLSKENKSDVVSVTANSFKTEPRVDYVSVFGGDGYMHEVPVPWDEYLPLQQNRVIKVKQLPVSEREFTNKLNDSNFSSILNSLGAATFSHGLLCCLTNSNGFDERLENLFKQSNQNTNI